MTVLAWFTAYRVSRSVKNLRKFVEAAEYDDIDDYDTKQFPNDELGEISAHVVNLYKNLKVTSEQRDQNMRDVLFAKRTVSNTNLPTISTTKSKLLCM